MTPDDRKIIHIDMDAFYASVEQRDHNELRNRPVAVGGSGKRGVVAAASYEARKFGVHSAMPSARALKLCPNIIFVKPRFQVYKEVSFEIRKVFAEYTDLIEPLSLDEAYLDVTTAKKGPPSATLIAKEIKMRIKEKTDLTASAGISYCKFLAKIASDMDKPDGLYVILPGQADGFLATLPIRKFHGIGKVTTEKMKKAGIFTGGDLRKYSLEDLIRRYGKVGSFYYDIVRGIDTRKVNPERNRKSVSAENTYTENIYDLAEAMKKLTRLSEEVFRRYQKTGVKGKTVNLKVKYADFQQITRNKTAEGVISTQNHLEAIVRELMKPDLITDKGIRLLGVGISNFVNEEAHSSSAQLTLKF